jgi:hypothetical protein
LRAVSPDRTTEKHAALRDDRPSKVAMISELDIWRAVNLLIRNHGADAELEAARLQDLMFELGDHEGWHLWQRIRRAVQVLRARSSGDAN